MKGKILSVIFLFIINFCWAQQDTAVVTKNLLSSFYFGGHIAPQISIERGVAGSIGFDLYGRVSNKFYLKTEFLYAFQQGEVMPYPINDVGWVFEGHEKWGLLKIPLTINYLFHKPESKIIYYPSIGIEEVVHLKKNNKYQSNYHYAMINIYSIIGFGVIYSTSPKINYFFEFRFEYNITNTAPISDYNGSQLSRKNNIIVGVNLGVLINSCNNKK